MPEKALKREWINYIDEKRVRLYPLQFANCDRLAVNDVVYIFDEAGSGKTISSGLMALDYLYNNPGKKVLVITINSLVVPSISRPEGQFLHDWFNKLPFRELNLEDKNLEDKVEVVNSHHSNLQRAKNERYGLVIIDEAQLFLENDTVKRTALKEIKADKVVFLSATPMKRRKFDLDDYVEIATFITKNNENIVSEKDITNKSDELLSKLNTENKEPHEIICSIFDEKSQITRYFKDTITALKTENGSKLQTAKRKLPETWDFIVKNDITSDKITCLIHKINCIHNNQPTSHFVIFTRYVNVEGGAYDIAKRLKDDGFKEWSENPEPDFPKTYFVIDENNTEYLSKVSGYNDIPTVLILSYQIGEQGINLPGFDYVVNFHIPAFPSSLEQRFGRIDRLEGANPDKEKEITMCFLLGCTTYKDSKNEETKGLELSDSNNRNYIQAVSTCINELLLNIPQKNTILSKDIVMNSLKLSDEGIKYLSEIEELINNDDEMNKLKEHYKTIKKMREKSQDETDTDNDKAKKVNDDDDIFINETENRLISFCIGDNSNPIEYDPDKDNEDKLKEEIKKRVSSLKSDLKDIQKLRDYGNEDELENILIKVFEEHNNEIFYGSGLKNLNFVHPVEECAKFIDPEINQNDENKTNYQKYKCELNKKFELLKVMHKISDAIEYVNKKYEDRFNNNDFQTYEEIKPAEPAEECVKKYLDDILEHTNIDLENDEKKVIYDNKTTITKRLPFYRLCEEYRKAIEEIFIKVQSSNKLNLYGEKNPFALAKSRVSRFIKTNLNRDKKPAIGLSDEFIKEHFSNNRQWHKDFAFQINSSVKKIDAPNWLKLAYLISKGEIYNMLMYSDSGELRSWGKWSYDEDNFENLVFHRNQLSGSSYECYDELTKEIWEAWSEYGFCSLADSDGAGLSLNLRDLKPKKFQENFDLSPLSRLTKLKELSIRQNDHIKISDCTPLSNLKELKKLELYTGITDISALSNLLELEELRIDCGTSNLSPIGEIIGLKILIFKTHTDISDLSPLGNLTKLEELHLYFDYETKIPDLSPLESLTKLKKLHIDFYYNSKVNNYSFLKYLSNLQALSIHRAEKFEIPDLSNLLNLEKLTLWDCKIETLKPFTNLPKPNILKIYVGGSNISISENEKNELRELRYIDT